jgi:hypothetical protein
MNESGLPGPKKFKRPNLAISTLKKTKFSNGKKPIIQSLFKKNI